MKAIPTLLITAQKLTAERFFRPFPTSPVSKERVQAVAKGTDTYKWPISGCCLQLKQGKRWCDERECAVAFRTPCNSLLQDTVEKFVWIQKEMAKKKEGKFL